jgi:hypothetical protein
LGYYRDGNQNNIHGGVPLKRTIIKVLIVCIILVGLFAAQAFSAGKPTLPLQPRLYLPEGVKCPKSGTTRPDDALSYFIDKDSDNQASFYDDNQGYLIKDVRKNGNIYYIKGIEVTTTGGHETGKFELTITIKNNTSFSLTEATGNLSYGFKGVYHYCGNNYK